MTSPEQFDGPDPEKEQLDPEEIRGILQRINFEEDLVQILQEVRHLVPAATTDSISGVATMMHLLEQLKRKSIQDVSKEKTDTIFAQYCQKQAGSLAEASYEAEHDIPLIEILMMSGFSKDSVVEALIELEPGASEIEKKNALSLKTKIEQVFNGSSDPQE